MKQTFNKLEELEYEIELSINTLVEKFESQRSMPDIGLRQFEVNILANEIERLLVQYSLESGEEVTVCEVPMSKFLDSDIGAVIHNGSLYSAYHLIKEWIGSITGNTRSNAVNTWYPNQKVRVLTSKYYDECILRMKEFEF